MLKHYLSLSWSNLRNRKVRSWLTLIGVVIGIAAVISLIGLGEGLRMFVAQQFSVADADVISVQASGMSGAGPPGTGVVDPLTDKELDAIRRTSGVDTAIGRIIDYGVIEYNGVGGTSFFASIPSGKYRKDTYDIANYEIEQGRLLKDGDGTRIVVGNDFTDKERYGRSAKPGDKITVNGTDYTIVGVLERAGSFVTDSSILMNEEQMREEFGTVRDEYDLFAVRSKEGANPSEIKVRIERELRKIRDVDEGEEDFTVQTREQAIQNLNSALFGVQMFVIVIASISIIVGGIGIMNTMYTAVLERIKDIGIMKATGAQNKFVFNLFFIESGLIGLIGGIIGVIIGGALAYGLAAIVGAALGNSDLRASISPLLVFGALAFSFLFGTIAGTLPAIRASKLNPVDALSYEK